MKYLIMITGFVFFCNLLFSQKNNTPSDILNRMLGNKVIESRIWNPQEKKFLQLNGKADFSKVQNGQYVQETFELDFFGKPVKGTAFIRYSEPYKRYELIQVDEAAVSSIVLEGKWDSVKQQLLFTPIKDYPQWGSKSTLQLQWNYKFNNDGSFTKEMLMPDANNQFTLQSDYTYKPVNNYVPKNPRYTDRHITIPDGTIHYRVIGTGKTILLNNGGPGWTCTHIEEFGEAISKLGYRVIMYDQRGNGESMLTKKDQARITLKKMTDDIEFIRKDLKLSEWIVAGHSFGSMLAANYAVTYPERVEKLLLFSSPGTDLSFLNTYQANLNMRLSEKEQNNIAYWTDSLRLANQPAEAAYQQVINTLPAFVYNKKKLPLMMQGIDTSTYNLETAGFVWNDLVSVNYNITAKTKLFNKPVLVLMGRQDALTEITANRLAASFPKSKKVLIDECAHILWVDQPEKVYDAIKAFVK
jgi:proline iminopeptidase